MDEKSLPATLTPLDVAQLMRRSVTTIAKYVKRGVLPRPRRLSYHVSIWDRDEILPVLRSLARDD